MTRGHPLLPDTRSVRSDVRQRFREVVQRGQERAEREEREHRGRLRASRQPKRRGSRWTMSGITK